MIENHLSFQFKARYYKSAEITASTKAIWFVLHGYGQLAQYFIRKFSVLERYGISVIAPEGLSRFYLDPIANSTRKTTRVGATWMTKEDRLSDIENYLAYLHAIYEKEAKEGLRVNILGFSQGSATASRWALQGNVEFDKLILWAGIFPPDMNFEKGSDVLKDKKVMLVYGQKDPFITNERFQEMTAISERLNTKVETISFEGGHDIDENTLVNLIEKGRV
jgi:predicted esterase